MDSYDNMIFAGVPNALGLLLLVWIYCYTADNESEEAALANMINVMQTVTKGVQENGGTTAESITQEAPKVDPDSEF